MAKVILLCGKIAVGKTTYAAYLQKKQPGIVLSCDDLMLSLFDACLGPRHDEVMRRCSAYLCKIAAQSVAAGVNAILDFGSWTAVERSTVRNFFSSHEIPFELHYLFCEERVRLERLRLRNLALQNATERVYIIDEPLCERLDSKFESPSGEETDRRIDMTHFSLL